MILEKFFTENKFSNYSVDWNNYIRDRPYAKNLELQTVV